MSFVIPAVNTWADLQKVLAALALEARHEDLEVVVVSRLGDVLDSTIRAAYPGVRLLAVPPDEAIPRMRARGVELAGAPLVAILEDHVIVPEGWVRRALAAAAASPDAVVAGPVGNLATATLVDRAAFLCEYSHCLPPVASGPSAWLPGNSVVYPAPLLRQHLRVVDGGGWEDELHASMRQSGTPLRLEAALEVGHDKGYTVGEYLTQRYLYARAWAGRRMAGRGAGARLVFAGSRVALPLLLLSRIAARAIPRTGHRETFVLGLPLLALFVLAWAIGECVGALSGPGNALARVR